MFNHERIQDFPKGERDDNVLSIINSEERLNNDRTMRNFLLKLMNHFHQIVLLKVSLMPLGKGTFAPDLH